MIMATALGNALAFTAKSSLTPDQTPAPSNDMPVTPGSDVVIMDAPPITDDTSSPSSEMPPLVSDLPSLASVSSVRHILVNTPCPVCRAILTVKTSRKHLRRRCGDWLRWAALRDAINRESNTTGSRSIAFERLLWIIEDVFSVTVPEIVARLDNLQDAQNLRSHVQRWYALEDAMMESAEHTNAQVQSVADDVAALHINDHI